MQKKYSPGKTEKQTITNYLSMIMSVAQKSDTNCTQQKEPQTRIVEGFVAPNTDTKRNKKV